MAKKEKVKRSKKSWLMLCGKVLVVLAIVFFVFYYVTENLSRTTNIDLFDSLSQLLEPVDEDTLISNPVSSKNDLLSSIEGSGLNLIRDSNDNYTPRLDATTTLRDNDVGALLNAINSEVIDDSLLISVCEFDINNSENSYIIKSILRFTLKSGSDEIKIYVTYTLNTSSGFSFNGKDIKVNINNTDDSDSQKIISILNKILEDSKYSVEKLFNYAVRYPIINITSDITLTDGYLTLNK